MRTKPKPSPAPREPEPATPGEIKQAIESLTREDTERIEQMALNRIHRTWRAANGRSHEDLIQEALIRILDRRRHWHKDSVSFTQCLIGAIRSIASEWASHHKRHQDEPDYAPVEADLMRADDEGKLVSPFDRVAAPALDPEQEAENRALVERIEAEFLEDEQASLLIMGMQDGLDGPTIRAALEMPEKEFRTTMRRIQRRVKKIMEQRNGG